MNKQELINVFDDTMKQVNDKKIICKSSTKKYNFTNAEVIKLYMG